MNLRVGHKYRIVVKSDIDRYLKSYAESNIGMECVFKDTANYGNQRFTVTKSSNENQVGEVVEYRDIEWEDIFEEIMCKQGRQI